MTLEPAHVIRKAQLNFWFVWSKDYYYINIYCNIYWFTADHSGKTSPSWLMVLIKSFKTQGLIPVIRELFCLCLYLKSFGLLFFLSESLLTLGWHVFLRPYFTCTWWDNVDNTGFCQKYRKLKDHPICPHSSHTGQGGDPWD